MKKQKKQAGFLDAASTVLSTGTRMVGGGYF